MRLAGLFSCSSAASTSLAGAAAAPAAAQFYIHSIGNYSYQALQWVIAGIPHALVQVLAPFFIKRFRPSRIVLFCTLLHGMCLLLMYPAIKAVGYDTIWGVVLLMVFTAAGWIPMGIAGIAKRLLQMNTFDYTAAQTGKRAEATSLMMYNMMSKWLWAAAALIGGFALAAIGFKEDVGGVMQMQSQATKDGLFFIFAMFPAIGNILGSLPMLFFKLEGKEFERRMAELNARREAEEAIEAGMK
jgi:Na+/melibiose symporter-like transporter